jgi:hypothetical protein
MASDIIRVASSFYRETACDVATKPLRWRSHYAMACGLASLPLMAIPLVIAAGHFMLEDRFNKSLLVDLVARPAGAHLRGAWSR